MTHLLEVKGTLDYGIYGYTALKTLTSAQNLNHADTYAVYANGKSIQLSKHNEEAMANNETSSCQPRQDLLVASRS